MLSVLHRRYTLVAKVPLSPDDHHQFWYLMAAELPSMISTAAFPCRRDDRSHGWTAHDGGVRGESQNSAANAQQPLHLRPQAGQPSPLLSRPARCTRSTSTTGSPSAGSRRTCRRRYACSSSRPVSDPTWRCTSGLGHAARSTARRTSTRPTRRTPAQPACSRCSPGSPGTPAYGAGPRRRASPSRPSRCRRSSRATTTPTSEATAQGNRLDRLPDRACASTRSRTATGIRGASPTPSPERH